MGTALVPRSFFSLVSWRDPQLHSLARVGPNGIAVKSEGRNRLETVCKELLQNTGTSPKAHPNPSITVLLSSTFWRDRKDVLSHQNPDWKLGLSLSSLLKVLLLFFLFTVRSLSIRSVLCITMKKKEIRGDWTWREFFLGHLKGTPGIMPLLWFHPKTRSCQFSARSFLVIYSAILEFGEILVCGVQKCSDSVFRLPEQGNHWDRKERRGLRRVGWEREWYPGIAHSWIEKRWKHPFDICIWTGGIENYAKVRRNIVTVVLDLVTRGKETEQHLERWWEPNFIMLMATEELCNLKSEPWAFVGAVLHKGFRWQCRGWVMEAEQSRVKHRGGLYKQDNRSGTR